MKNIQLLFSLFILGMLFTSCSKDVKATPDTKEQRIYDLRYGSYKSNLLDVYLPAGRDANTPFLILLHGGGWVSGDKSDMRYLQDHLIKRGIASAAVNYRLADDKTHYKDLMHDVDIAIKYCFNNHDNWNIRQDRFMISGASAGGHMALLYAYRFDEDKRTGGIISLCGPTDVTQEEWLKNAVRFGSGMGLLEMIEKMVGTDFVPGQKPAAIFADASPRFHIKNIPALMIHGVQDTVVPFSQAQTLADDLSHAGFTHKLVTFQDAGHDLDLDDPASLQLLLDEMETWCKTYGR